MTPEALEKSDRLRALTTPRGRIVDVDLTDDDLAASIYDHCSEHVHAVVTRLPGSTISDEELRMAAAAGVQVAEADSSGSARI